MYNCKDWDNYDNLESTETQVDHVMIDKIRAESKSER